MVMWECLATVVSLALFALLAVRFGVDSRDGFRDLPQPPLGSFRGSEAQRRSA